ncbi:MAG TPA: HIT domain-containing protein [Gemmataceae bacterium]|jgi:diadenosine tetraphosphate (Ap4A) HIT family hydrolase
MSESTIPECPFCRIAEERIILHSELGFTVFDAIPVSPGHSLVIPRRHVASFFDLTGAEVMALHELLQVMRSYIQQAFSPDGYNIGVNIGRGAGQTVAHAHVHLIPRYLGDVPVPEGGIRNVILGKGRYREVCDEPEAS